MSLYNRESAGANRYIAGDDDPSDSSFLDPLSASELLNLLQRNSKVRKATSWVAREAVRPRFIMRNDKVIRGTKHGSPYVFPTIVEYIEWIGFFTEIEKG